MQLPSILTKISFSPRLTCARGLCLIGAILFAYQPQGHAEDWPQILGPNRNGVAVELPMEFAKWQPELKPKWEFELGAGYAGAAVVGDVVYIPHRIGNSEVLTALELKTGRMQWQSSWKTSYRGSFHPDSGPRCVPAIEGDKVVCYGAAGDLVCFDMGTGAELWLRPLRTEYEAEDGYFGAGSSPLIVQGMVIVCVGGDKAGVVAVDLETGSTKWTATTYEASYASPVQFDLGSELAILAVMRLNTVLLRASDGTVLSDVKFGSRGPTVNAATPIAIDTWNKEFLLTSSYNVGTLVLNIKGMQLTEKYRNRRLLASQYNSPVFVQGTVFGIDGREDIGNGKLRAIDPQNQEILWEDNDFGTAHLIGLDERVLAMDLDGRLVVFAADREKFRLVAQTQLPTSTYRSLPTLVGRYFLARGSDGPASSRLMMFQLP